MTMLVLQLVMMLLVILAASELFTNALEHLGEKLHISDGVTGSLFAAVGTALPETMVPLLALLAGTTNIRVNEEIGVGAILGAPLMLSTLSTCLMAFSILKQRGAIGHIRPEQSGFVRDLNFFLLAFSLAAVAMYVPVDARYTRGTISMSLMLIYFVYIMLTLRASKQLVENGHGTEAENKIFLAKFGLPTNSFTIFMI